MRRLTSILLGTVLLVACQGQPANLLTDPSAILAAAVSSTASSTAVHIDVSADGPIEFDPLNTGAGASINLRGTTASADVDIAGQKARATFASPNLMNIVGEAIAIDRTVYLKSSLSGPKYLATTTPQPDPSSPVPSAQALQALTDLLARSDLKPVKGDDVPCAGGTCYTVTLHVTGEDLAGLLGSSGTPAGGNLSIPGVPLPNLADATADLAVHVEQTTTRLSGIDATVHLGDTGDPKLTATFTKWNEPVTITAPPADQVQTAP